jgi:hypothetical protein
MSILERIRGLFGRKESGTEYAAPGTATRGARRSTRTRAGRTRSTITSSTGCASTGTRTVASGGCWMRTTRFSRRRAASMSASTFPGDTSSSPMRRGGESEPTRTIRTGYAEDRRTGARTCARSSSGTTTPSQPQHRRSRRRRRPRPRVRQGQSMGRAVGRRARRPRPPRRSSLTRPSDRGPRRLLLGTSGPRLAGAEQDPHSLVRSRG